MTFLPHACCGVGLGAGAVLAPPQQPHAGPAGAVSPPRVTSPCHLPGWQRALAEPCALRQALQGLDLSAHKD